MRTFLTILFVLILSSSSFAADKPAKTAKSAKPEKTETTKPIKRIDTMLAVFDLEITEGVTKGISRPLSESIRREIVMSGRYEVIDRGNMNKILGEQKFQLSGCAAGECIVEAGQLLGVGKIVTGSIGLVGKTYYLSLSVINVETGKIENSSEDKCKCEIDDLIDSSKRLVNKLLGEKAAEAKPVQEAKTTYETEAKTTETKEPSEQKPVIASETKQSQKPSTTTDSSGMEFVFVKGGCYQMGDTLGDGYAEEKPVHEVCVDDFYMGQYEVTQGQWKAIMGNNRAYFKDCGDNCPVEYASWNDAQDFINKLNQKTGKNYRLPTEAEWEYAARSGGKNEKYSGGNDIDSVAWYDKNSGSKTHPVGTKSPNGLGIYDMSGNVWEWVNDWYDKNYYKSSPKDNPKGPSSGTNRVLRSGSWFNSPWNIRAAARRWHIPGARLSYFGFRLAGSR